MVGILIITLLLEMVLFTALLTRRPAIRRRGVRS